MEKNWLDELERIKSQSEGLMVEELEAQGYEKIEDVSQEKIDNELENNFEEIKEEIPKEDEKKEVIKENPKPEEKVIEIEGLTPDNYTPNENKVDPELLATLSEIENSFSSPIEELPKEIKEIPKEEEEIKEQKPKELTLEEKTFKKTQEAILKEFENFLETHLGSDYLSKSLEEKREEAKKLKSKIESEIPEEKKQDLDYIDLRQILKELSDKEDEEKEQEENENTPKKRQKYLHGQMRALLRDYPMRIDFSGTNTFFEILGSVIQVYDLLYYCKLKTNDENVESLFDTQINNFEQLIDIKKLRSLLNDYNQTDLQLQKKFLYSEMKELITQNDSEIIQKVIFFSLAIPSKEKKYMHLKTAHGLPASSAEEYESEAISEGQKVEKGQPFVINEEGAIELA